jgi:hypothetical protein
VRTRSFSTIFVAAAGVTLLSACAGGAASSSAPAAGGALPLSSEHAPVIAAGTSAKRRTLAVTGCPGATLGTGAFVGGGQSNVAHGQDATVAGGQNNEACYDLSTIGGGYFNTIAGGGSDNTSASFIGGGTNNAISGDSQSSVIGGGDNNAITGGGTAGTNAIVGGESNTLSGDFGFIGAGTNNTVSGEGAYIAAGGYNVASGEGAVIDGGFQSTASGAFSTIPGGYVNIAGGTYSFAAGARAHAPLTGDFVWSDGSAGDGFLTSTRAYQFMARASGGYILYSDRYATVGVSLAPGSGTWASVSDRNLKTDVTTVDDGSVLEKVAALPISRWSYKSEHGVRHVGPMAQDFYAAFKVGEDDRHITSIDEDGVALAAIKALHARVGALGTENARLRARLGAMAAADTRRDAELASLRTAVEALRAR